MITSYHNHSTWSDGQGSLAEMLAAARLAGLDEFGFSDHFTLFPDGAEQGWTMAESKLDGYVGEVIGLGQRTCSPVVRLGIEADFFPETVDRLRAVIARYPFDYVIGSVHFLGTFPIDLDACYWHPLPSDEVCDKWTIYWQRIRQLAASGVFDFVGHLDLPKKYGYHMPQDLMSEALEALDAIAKADMAIEINTAGWHVPAAELYPAPELLHAACQRGIPLLINADAHLAQNVARDFDRARAAAKEAGYRSLVRYEQRKRHSIAL